MWLKRKNKHKVEPKKETKPVTPKTVSLIESIISRLIPAYNKRGEMIVTLNAQVADLGQQLADFEKAVEDVSAAVDLAIPEDVGGSLAGIVEDIK